MAQVNKSHCGDHGRYLSQPENGGCYTLAIIFSIIKDKDEIPAGIVETSGTAAHAGNWLPGWSEINFHLEKRKENTGKNKQKRGLRLF